MKSFVTHNLTKNIVRSNNNLKLLVWVSKPVDFRRKEKNIKLIRDNFLVFFIYCALLHSLFRKKTITRHQDVLSTLYFSQQRKSLCNKLRGKHFRFHVSFWPMLNVTTPPADLARSPWIWHQRILQCH